MTRRTWIRQKTIACERVDQEVTLEVEVVEPVEMLPDQPPRLLGHRCSYGIGCNALDRPMCVWAGTLPGYDPFA